MHTQTQESQTQDTPLDSGLQWQTAAEGSELTGWWQTLGFVQLC